jgi:Ca2+-binding EF-hand superfamily protein
MLTFTHILSTGTDPEETLRQAFQMFDADNTGYIPEE